MSMPETVNFFCPKCSSKMWVKDSRGALFHGQTAVQEFEELLEAVE